MGGRNGGRKGGREGGRQNSRLKRRERTYSTFAYPVCTCTCA